MKELNQIRQAVVEALSSAGVTAFSAYPDRWAQEQDGPVVTVDVGTVESGALGLCNYLGECYDQERGTVQEVYGKQLDAELLTDVWGRSAADCQAGCQQAAEVLLGGLPEGLRPGELAWEGLCWEKEPGLFRRRGRLRCRALFVAQGNEEDPQTFLDFQLKGVVTH